VAKIQHISIRGPKLINIPQLDLYRSGNSTTENNIMGRVACVHAVLENILKVMFVIHTDRKVWKRKIQSHLQHSWWCNDNKGWHKLVKGGWDPLLPLPHLFSRSFPIKKEVWLISERLIRVRNRSESCRSWVEVLYWSLFLLPSLWLSAAWIDYWRLGDT